LDYIYNLILKYAPDIRGPADNKKNIMKKLAYILVLVFAMGILFTSCNKKANCPAYRGQLDQEQVETPKA